MCLAIPMQIKEVSDLKDSAIAIIDGQKRQIDILLLDDVQKGDWVLVLSKQAIKVVSEKEAFETKEIMQAILNGESFEHTEPQLPEYLQKR